MNKFFTVLSIAAVLLLSTAVRAKVITIMPLGDSITAGYNNVNGIGGYRSYLYSELKSQGVQTQFQGIVADTTSPTLDAADQDYYTAQSGYDTGAIYGNLDGSVGAINSGNSNYGGYWMTGGHSTGRSAYSPDIVLLLSGANDWSGPSETEAGLTNILSWFNTYRPQTEVIVTATAPEFGYGNVPIDNPRAVNNWLKSYVPANCPQDRVADVFDAFLNPDGSVNSDLIPEYSVHPNEAGYKVIADVFDAAIMSSISASSVPEPTCGVLLCIGAASMLRRRRCA